MPPEHKAQWFAGAALNTSEQVVASVLSTALSRLNAFLDLEMEQILCFDPVLDVEQFCKEKSALYLILPEENPTTFFLVSLFIQQFYREILSVADEYGGKLPHRAVAVYLYLRGRANKEGQCWPYLHTMARDLKLSVRTVQRGIADLKQAGYLETEQRYRQSGAKSSLLFRLWK